MRPSLLKIAVALFVALVFASGVAAVYASDNVEKLATPVAKKLPKLIDLGSTKCIPCKMMTPILDQLEKDYKGQLDVQFIDVAKNPSAAGKYKVKTIPTQILYNAKGKEVWRHQGYIPKADILKAAKDKGIVLNAPAEPKK